MVRDHSSRFNHHIYVHGRCIAHWTSREVVSDMTNHIENVEDVVARGLANIRWEECLCSAPRLSSCCFIIYGLSPRKTTCHVVMFR